MTGWRPARYPLRWWHLKHRAAEWGSRIHVSLCLARPKGEYLLLAGSEWFHYKICSIFTSKVTCSDLFLWSSLVSWSPKAQTTNQHPCLRQACRSTWYSAHATHTKVKISEDECHLERKREKQGTRSRFQSVQDFFLNSFHLLEILYIHVNPIFILETSVASQGRTNSCTNSCCLCSHRSSLASKSHDFNVYQFVSFF